MVLGWLLLILPVQPVSARQDRLETVRANCGLIKLRLKQVKLDDSLTRVNYGQTYESLIKNVLTPVNTRLVANRYDASALITLTTNFNNDLSLFRSRYQEYKNQMNELVNFDCANYPAEFYQKLESARVLRRELQSIVVKLNDQTVAYQQAVARLVDGKL